MSFEFDSEIKQLVGKIKWSVFYFPYSAAELFGTEGKVPVRITVDGHAFAHTLLPSHNGHYLVYNEFIRTAVGKKLGDTVHVTLERDVAERKYMPPAHIENALAEGGVLAQYQKQPDYLKREQVNYIQVAKKEETRENRLKKLIEKLRAENG